MKRQIVLKVRPAIIIFTSGLRVILGCELDACRMGLSLKNRQKNSVAQET
jgi:hypothetical protein